MATYNLTQAIPGKLLTGDILNCPYSGAAVQITLPGGRYKLECWGAQGGYRSSESYGGKGGYAAGELSMHLETRLFLRAGASGNNGGYNGGGTRSTHKGGGGASDIRIGQDSLYARVLAAGGGGSDGASNKAGGYGGGESGESRSDSYGSGGGGGTQTAGGTGGSGNSGEFGPGGAGLYRSNGYGGAGGGGWYGGGGAYPDGSGDDDRGGGGGSGFVWTGSNAPSGYLLTASHYLTGASTKAGNVSFAAPSGSAETGHSGDGYARITVLEIYKVVPGVPGNFRQTAQDYFSIGLAWDSASDAAGYRLYRAGALIATLTGTAYTDTHVQSFQTYQYALLAYNADGDSDTVSISAKTTQEYAEIKPIVTAASFSVNPANINAQTVLTVSVTEEIMILKPELWYCGEIFSGEV